MVCSLVVADCGVSPGWWGARSSPRWPEVARFEGLETGDGRARVPSPRHSTKPAPVPAHRGRGRLNSGSGGEDASAWCRNELAGLPPGMAAQGGIPPRSSQRSYRKAMARVRLPLCEAGSRRAILVAAQGSFTERVGPGREKGVNRDDAGRGGWGGMNEASVRMGGSEG